MMPRFRATPAVVLAVAFAAVFQFCCATSARADLFLTVQPSSAQAGGTGGFDVDLSNIGGSTSFDVSSFSVELSVSAGSGVLFTGANVSTVAPYIFGTLQAAPLTFNTFPTTDFIASDSWQSAPAVTTLNVGDTYGLMHVAYSVASGTALGPVTVTIEGIGVTTQILDVGGNLFPFTPQVGTVSVVPEPSSGWLLASALIVASVAPLARRRQMVCGSVRPYRTV